MNFQDRAGSAKELAFALSPQIDTLLPQSEPPLPLWIVLLLPPEMHGISLAAQLLVQRLMPVTLTAIPLHADGVNQIHSHRALAQARRTGPTLILDAIPPALATFSTVQEWRHVLFQDSQGTNSRQIDISATYAADSHPMLALLFLLSLLAHTCSTNLEWSLSSQLKKQIRSLGVDSPEAENPAKTLARQLYARIPIFWSTSGLEGIAADCCLRYQWYAESAAFCSDQWTVSRTQIMGRFPRFWPNSAAYVQFTGATSLLKTSAPSAQNDKKADLEAAMLSETLHTILTRRKFPSHKVTLSGDSLLDQYVYGLELSEWLALYASALYEVDPAARVPFQLLF